MKRYLPVSEGKRLNICVFACISTQKTVSLHDVNNKLKEENQEIKVEKQENILNMYDIQEQLKKINDRKIWLRCGGFITIDKTEALTAIDVNSRKIHWQERLGTYNFYSK